MPDWEIINLRGQKHAVIECGTCGIIHTVPLAMLNEHFNEGGFHHCPNGHSRGWTKEGSEFTRLQRERDRLKQRVAEEHDNALAELKLRLAVERREAKLKRRINGGACPCCNRHFIALQRHMKTKHPQFTAENVVPLKATA